MSGVEETAVAAESHAAVLRPTARPRTATSYVSDSLRRSILNGDLVGGTKLSLVELASTFGVSTTPVREAMRELSFEGLVTIDSYRGGVVTAVTKPEVEEIVRIRQVLEPIAAREAVAGMTPVILAEAQAILDEMAASDSWDVWVQGNRGIPSQALRGVAVPAIGHADQEPAGHSGRVRECNPAEEPDAQGDGHQRSPHDDRGDPSKRRRPSHRGHVAAPDDPDQRLTSTMWGLSRVGQ